MLAPNTPIKITDHLYLGNFDAALNENIVDDKITAVVCLTKYKHEYPPEVNLLHIDDISDSLTESSFTLEKLVEAVEFIKTNIANNRNVIVHCRAGASRSPTVIIAYMMQRDKLTVSDAVNFVARKAPHINPTFLNLLESFEKLK